MKNWIILSFSLEDGRTKKISFASFALLWLCGGGRDAQEHKCVLEAEIPRTENVVNQSGKLAFVHIPSFISKLSPYT